MKNLKKVLALVVAVAMIASMGLVASAASYSDVASNASYADAVNLLSNLGIITGYEDGTFKPDKSISKIEAVLLFARVAGFADANNEKIVELANDKYAAVLDAIDLGAYTNYKNEIAFLLYKNVLSADTIEEYLGESKYLDEFPRSDAAILIANLMGADIKEISASSLDFADANQIPDEAVKYVSYVVKEGLMNGVQKDDGTVVFDAEKALSRAQVCVLLYRIIDKLNISAEAGIVDSFDTESGVLEFTNAEGREKSYVINEDVKVIINGENGKDADKSQNI